MAILATAPEGATVLDIGAARVARAEARAAAGVGTPVLKVSAGYVEVRPEVDLDSADLFLTGDLKGGLAKLLADPADVDAVLAGGLSREDLDAIGTFITGLSQGESQASPAS